MKFIHTDIEGVLILEPKVFDDKRGYFYESYSKRELDEALGYEINFVQDNQSKSHKNVVRGLHLQLPPHAQAKLVRCIKGRVLDVALDLRNGSPTYGNHIAIELSEENRRQFFVPRGFAHGFAVLSDEAVFQYKCDNYYHPEAEAGINLFDPTLKIDWKVDINDAILSAKDLILPTLESAELKL